MANSILGEAFNLINFMNIYAVNFTEYNFATAGTGVFALRRIG
jgi:hypothetical protein